MFNARRPRALLKWVTTMSEPILSSSCFSFTDAARQRYGVWQRVSWLNARHMLFAWLSLVWVGLADLYVRLCSMGYIHDLSTWG